MWRLDLEDDELRALHALLIEKTRQPVRFRHSPTYQAYCSILGKIDRVEEAEIVPRFKPPAR
jgi:hypothetical protein